jgi:hypothetical protein
MNIPLKKNNTQLQSAEMLNNDLQLALWRLQWMQEKQSQQMEKSLELTNVPLD